MDTIKNSAKDAIPRLELGEFAGELDARALSAPMAVVRAHRALRQMQPGEQLRVTSTDAAAFAAFRALAKVRGYTIVAQEQRGDESVHVLTPTGAEVDDSPWVRAQPKK
jgi:tRNA 2-thiouridine synthesizing protein A